ncbi:MAG: gamma-glutamylcyclotransferase [Mucilaginibacter sp.]|uniref:gamma-glutamylcyclotransferase family protein n=1 Tax=Mucilaginibacter sp. TaxID=1882438 RepID=UPI0026035D08|nr:gamma-glutamylcyclotransferase family protein [Mucilaginibacter sp.]MDB5004310.1 gamma-glutamylcyclotransferase [Mucilaginibacter sp.]
MINDLLFVYGTLLIDDNKFAAYLRSNAIFYNTGTIKGKLYDVGTYPGLIISNDQDYLIKGTIYQLNNAEEILKYLDPYEGFGDEQEQPNLFIRESLPIETSDGVINCWVYLYNLSIDGLNLITHGDYVAYLNQKRS